MIIDLYYIAGAGATLVLGLIGYLLYQLSNARTRVLLASSENTKLIWSVESLNSEKLYNIKHIQELTDQAEHLTKSNDEHRHVLKESSDSVESLKAEKLRDAQIIQEMTTKVEYLTKTNEDQEKLRKEAFDSAKASLFDLGNGLSKQLLELHKQESQEVRQQSEKNIATTNEKFTSEFQKIVSMVGILEDKVNQSTSTVDLIKSALASPAGAGKLAEMTLENLLKNSNLRPGTDYSMQHHITKEDGSLRPDALIFLPGDNLMIVDAKASKFLVEMEEAKTEEERANRELEFIKSMNRHLKTLVSKEYADNTVAHYQIKSQQFGNVFTLMFLPTDSSLDRISKIDPQFINKAFAQNILPVGPSGLMNMLAFARFQINDHQRIQNHHLIIEEVKKLLGSVATLAHYSQKLGNNIQSLANNYDKYSASFNRNFLPKARKMQHLGVDLGKSAIKPLERYHIISAESELIEVESEEVAMLNDAATPEIEEK